MSKSNDSTGIGFFGMLTILFIGLKLTGYIDWSWWWVLSPMLGISVLVIIMLVFYLGSIYVWTKGDNTNGR